MSPEAGLLESPPEADTEKEWSQSDEKGGVAILEITPEVEEATEAFIPTEPTNNVYQREKLTPDEVESYKEETVGKLRELLEKVGQLEERASFRQKNEFRVLLKEIRKKGERVLDEVTLCESSLTKRGLQAYRAHYVTKQLEPLVDSLEQCLNEKMAIPSKIRMAMRRIKGR